MSLALLHARVLRHMCTCMDRCVHVCMLICRRALTRRPGRARPRWRACGVLLALLRVRVLMHTYMHIWTYACTCVHVDCGRASAPLRPFGRARASVLAARVACACVGPAARAPQMRRSTADVGPASRGCADGGRGPLSPRLRADVGPSPTAVRLRCLASACLHVHVQVHVHMCVYMHLRM